MRLVGVGRRYGVGGPWILRGVDLDLGPGSGLSGPVRRGGALVRVEGANGSGKSTLLRLLAGIDAPTAGRVEGRPRTAYVPERFPAVLPFTATGYLVHLGRIHGLERSVARDRAGEWLERFGAAGYARTPLPELSKGTSQKVAVAQALVAEPELLVLDEAWTGLDARARGELDRVVAERVAAGATVVFVDHDAGRLAGAVDAVLRVGGGGVVRAAAAGAGAAASGTRTRIDAVGPEGAPLPAGLPGAPEVVRGPDGGVRLTVPAVHSDAVLRALLGARPPWHVRGVLSAAPDLRDAGHGDSAALPDAADVADAADADGGGSAPVGRRAGR
ncbi:ATP-binding cassette domain-containing protein [Streptomyces sp. Wb2n-11]|uniref:ATP-binding cassette domain-containing protein n=1 Tax=Streptomyces sp. Wb2n-11 TaxID=1030533 RepID=UPI000B8666A7|nr:ATP-binding cassette domain-containing protein [Streptomyces sp. Wb2n-11]